jgi:hypothetical protein
LKCEKEIPSIVESLKDAKAAFKQAKAEHNVYPTAVSKEKLRSTQKAFDTAQLGLQIFAENKEPSTVQTW